MKYSESIKQAVQSLSELGLSSRKIASELGISKSGVNDLLNRVHCAVQTDPAKTPNLLYLDIETAPCIAAVFGRFNINLSQANIVQNGGQLISVCWSWNDEPEVQGVVMTPKEARDRDDSRIVAELYEAIENADILVWQNGNNFDLKKIKTRCVMNGLPPPKTCKTADTLLIAKQLGFPSNRLDALGDYLGVGRKQPNSGMSLWLDCLAGVPEALEEMFQYNKQDVLLLRDVYKKIRAFDNRHPNVGQYYSDEKKHCTVCGSTDLHQTGHSVYTQVSEFAEVQCGSCGHRMRERSNLKTKEQMKKTLMNAQG